MATPSVNLYIFVHLVDGETDTWCLVCRCCRCVRDRKGTRDIFTHPSFVLAVLLLWNFGLLIVDRILQLGFLVENSTALNLTHYCSGVDGQRTKEKWQKNRPKSGYQKVKQSERRVAYKLRFNQVQEQKEEVAELMSMLRSHPISSMLAI